MNFDMDLEIFEMILMRNNLILYFEILNDMAEARQENDEILRKFFLNMAMGHCEECEGMGIESSEAHPEEH